METGLMPDGVVKAACGICPMGCGVNVHVEGGKITKVDGMPEHPLNRGKTCVRADAAQDFIYHPDRLKYPMKKENGGWKRISWEEALDTIASKLKEVKETYGPTALAICFGMPVLTQGTTTIGFIRRFCDVYGTPSVFSVDSMCWRSRLIGDMGTYGWYPLGDPSNSKCILIWGTNPHDSGPMLVQGVVDAVKKGAKLVVIDPRRTSFAKRADIHLQPRPGTDCALALGMLNVIITEKLYDKEFVEKWTFGFDKLEEHIKRYPPEEVEKITLVPSQAIREVARLYATIKPACIESGTNTLEEQGNAVQTCRAIAILQAVTGNFMVSGGYIATSRVHKHSLRLLDLVKEKPLGTDRFPLFYALWGRLLGEGEGQAMLVPNAILTGKPYPIKVMIVSGSNILLSWPNSNKVREALSKLDFLVVMDLFMTETAKQADIVLPAASGFERNEVFDFYTVLYPITYIMMRRKFLQIGECWPDMKLYIELAKRMGYEEYFPWKTMEEVVDYTYEPAGISIKRLTEEEPGGLSYGYLRNNKDYERLGFPTPSGKVEIYSKLLEELGHDPLPTFKEPIESPISRPDLAKDYPLILSTGTRKYPFMHSQFHQIPRLRKMAPEAFIEVHPDTAAKYGLRDGETAIVETKRGSIESKVKATEDIMPDLVSIACGWEEANANILTDETSADPMSGFPSLRAQLCRIRKK